MLFLFSQEKTEHNPESHEEEPEEEPEDEEEEESRVLTKTDGRNIALCMFGIMTALITITVRMTSNLDMLVTISINK